jgi:phosphoglycolate phosphatase
MNSVSTIIFDFDGTIADSVKVIFEIMNEISPEFGYKRISKDGIAKFRNLGTERMIRELNIPRDRLEYFNDRIRQELKNKDLKPVNGMVEVIRSLKIAQFHMGILTSNALNTVKKFLSNYKIECFDYIYPEAGIYGKGGLLNKMIGDLRLDPGKMVFIGDETRDIDAGKTCGVRTIAVTWGLNGIKPLTKRKPDWLIETPKELLKIFN